MTPLGFIPLKQAVERCSAVWNIPIEPAFERLRPLLWDGQVKSVAASRAGSRQEIRDEWGANCNRRAYRDGRIAFEFFGKVMNTLPVFVCEENLTDILRPAGAPKEEDAAPAMEDPEITQKDKGGRPTKYSDHLFLVEAFRILYENSSSKQPKTEAQFRQAALQAFAERGAGTPSDDWARPLIKLIVSELHVDFEKPR